MSKNPELLDIPTTVKTVDDDSVTRLNDRLHARMEELKEEGWKPSGGWANETEILKNEAISNTKGSSKSRTPW